MNDAILVTHPERAWLITIVPAALTVAAVLLGVILLRRPLVEWLNRMQLAPQNTGIAIDPALLRHYAVIPTERLSMIGLLAATLTAIISALFAPIWLALVIVGPTTAALIALSVRIARLRYVENLERDLTEAVGRFSALLRAGVGFRAALERLQPELSPGPLRDEWTFLLERQGVPLANGLIATPQQVVGALAEQTPSARHAALLEHIALAVNQPQDVLSTRVATAYNALQAANRRREEALTELAQMRYSGMAVGGSGMLMALYLLWTQADRALQAYSSPLGVLMAIIVVFALVLPIVGGFLLAQAEDLDY